MKVLLLGATGLLGHNVLRRLAAEGHETTAIVRRREGLRTLPDATSVVVGNPLDSSVLSGAAAGCEAIVNCAGATDMSMLHRSDYDPANRDLCRTVVEVMEQQGIKRLVHTSTANTIGYGSATEPADEEAPMEPPFTASLYATSKRAGEEVAIEAARRHPDWHVVVLNPGFMLGAWDVKPSSGRMLLAAYRRRLMAAPPGGKAFVAVDDVAAAAVNALAKGRSGERYIVACHNMTVKALYELQAATMGYRQRVLTLPAWLVAAAGALGSVARSLGIRTELSLNNTRQLCVKEYYDGSQAERELDIRYTPIEQPIKKFHQWREQQKR